MNASEFTKQERATRLFDRWLWDKTIETPLGKFEVELHMSQENDVSPPDKELIRRAAELVCYAKANGNYILDIVFGHYLLAAESDPAWLDCCDVPRGIPRNDISEYLQGLWLVTSRHLEWEKPYDSVIFINPLWDEEHKLSLDFQDGKIVSVNDSPFKIVNGVLR